MDWQITPVWKSGTGTSSDMGLNGQFCASFTLKNPKKVTASGFILTMSSCENLAYFTSISGYSDICNNNYSFRMRGSGISIKGGATVTNLLEFCINVNFGGSNLFQFPNHIRYGIDLYDSIPNCDLPDYQIYCGNGIVEKGEGTTCSIDTKALTCPTRR